MQLRQAGSDNPVGLYIDSEGQPHLELFDRKTRAGLDLGHGNGNPGIKLQDRNGVVRENLSLVLESEPLVELYDAAGKARVTLGATSVKNEKTGVLEKRSISSLTLLRRDREGDF